MHQEGHYRRLALVLSGGGARGAYEIGVLCNLLPRLARLKVSIDIIAATSVGALNACALAATAHLSAESETSNRVQNLRQSWESIEATDVFVPTYLSSLLTLPLHLANLKGPHLVTLLRGNHSLGQRLSKAFHRRPYGFRALYDTTPLVKTLVSGGMIDWRQLRRNLGEGNPLALALSSTRIQTGETVVFTGGRLLTRPRDVPDEHLHLRPVDITHLHALASAAIPFLFPPVRIQLADEKRHALFIDGGVRQNTPLLPAILLGADSIVVLGLHTLTPEPELVDEPDAFDAVPILGKILNSFFLDRIRTDFNRLTIMNKLIQTAHPERLHIINADRLARGKDPLREIRAVEITPTRDIGRLTAELWEAHHELRKVPWRWLFDGQRLRGPMYGDLLSYVFFHPEYARTLIQLGEADAAREVSDATLHWLAGHTEKRDPIEIAS